MGSFTDNSPYKQEEFIFSDKGEDIIQNAPEPDPNLGFANFPEYIVVGKKKTTNRKNTRYIRASNESAARNYAISVEGLIEPLDITVAQFQASDKILEYGLSVPAGASKWDAWQFELSCHVKDTKHIPPAFMEYATQLGVPLSWLCGRNRAVEEVFKHCNLREKSILYGYAVHCSLQGHLPGNIEKEPLKYLYIQFAEAASLDIKVCKSISKRPGSDMWEPNQRTYAYQFAIKFFQQKI